MINSEVFDNQIDNAFWLGSSYVMDQVTNFGLIRNNSHLDTKIVPLHDGQRHFGYWVKYGLGFSIVRLQNSRTGIYRRFHIENNINSCDNIAVNTVDRYKLAP